VAAFEREFAAFVGAPCAAAVSNCTTALHLALRVVGVAAGDEVVTVSHSFVATANAIRYLGATPVFVDIEPDTFNMDPDAVAAAITPRTRAILCVHQMGMPCQLAEIMGIARRHNLPVVEDAACAIGSEIKWEGAWERIGRPHADIACFSFHPRKVITTGDGGMITTANAEWDRQFRLLRQHGMSVPDTVRHGSSSVIFETYDVLGYNYRLTDLQAAVGRAQLRKLPGLIARRRQLAERYHQRLAAMPAVRPPTEPAWARSNWQSYPVRLAGECAQREIMQALLDEGVASRRGIMCAHRHAAYPPGTWSAGPCRAGARPLAQSEAAEDQVLLLPLYADMTTAEQDQVADALLRACARRNRVAAPARA
jgi:dTDP-4-amino-4,6-dideoxygalactose transaminase